eukprot:TRINITY_DN32910_c0_g1_i10.p2 TRINITY_DN32910_c0_g1~~TRINITY_DN32910_c0_g1_i10.p2  ORF type:complete len:128 (+),score=13.48 TRINITY_DN32910_c0_g1_i10:969-1352(+)
MLIRSRGKVENRAWTSGNSHHRTCSSLVKICFFSLCARGTCLGESHTREECSTSTGHVLQAIEKHLQSRKKDRLNNILQGSILIFVVSAWIHGLYTRVAAHPKNTMLEKVQLILLEIWSVHHTKLLT